MYIYNRKFKEDKLTEKRKADNNNRNIQKQTLPSITFCQL